MNSAMLTYEDLAEKWGKSIRSIARMKRARKIEYVKIGRSIRFKPESVEAAEKVFKAKGLI